jgi:hypothetical protein
MRVSKKGVGVRSRSNWISLQSSTISGLFPRSLSVTVSVPVAGPRTRRENYSPARLLGKETETETGRERERVVLLPRSLSVSVPKINPDLYSVAGPRTRRENHSPARSLWTSG